jgi:hypothetical protein
MVSYRSGDVVGARSILGRYLAGVLSIYELAENRYQTTIDALSHWLSDIAVNQSFHARAMETYMTMHPRPS